MNGPHKKPYPSHTPRPSTPPVSFDAGLLDELRVGADKTNGVLGRGAKQTQVEELERVAGITIPQEFRQFLLAVNGCVIPGRLQILGLDALTDRSASLEEALALLRFGFGLTTHLLPIEDLQDGLWAVLDCSPKGGGAVQEMVVSASGTGVRSRQHYPSFNAYFRRRLNRPPDWEAIAQRTLRERIAEFQKRHDYSHRGKGKLPRNHDWRPYRFCIQDVVFGSTVVRHSRELNCLEVDVFLTAEVQSYDPLAGAMALTRFILSEAWKCGGTMEVRFSNVVEGGHVPAALCKLAERYGIQLSGSRVKPNEARSLYAALTGFSAPALDRLKVLEAFERLSVAQACYLVHQNLWTVTQVEFLLSSELPEIPLRGLVSPLQRLLWNYGLQRARGAGLAGLLMRTLAKRSTHTSGNQATEMEDDVIPLRVSIVAEFDVLEIVADEPLTLPWTIDGPNELAPGKRAWVFVRSWSIAELPLIEAFIDQQELGADFHALLVAKDFESLPTDVQDRCQDAVSQLGVSLLVAPETTDALDSDAMPKMTRARLLRK